MNNDFNFWFWLGVIADFAQLESYEMLLKDSNNNDIMLKLDEMLSNVAHLSKALQVDETELLARLAVHCAYAQEQEYHPIKARQAISKFIRNR